MPALPKRSLLCQKPTMPVSTGDAYVFPPVPYGSNAAGMSVSFQAATSAVMSLTIPASACWKSTPPPQVWKMSGGLPAWMFVVSFVLNASFSSGVISNLTPGCAASNWCAMSAHFDSIGSVFAMCHHLIVLVDPDLPPESPPPHAPRSVAPAAAPARPNNDLRLIRVEVITFSYPFGPGGVRAWTGINEVGRKFRGTP